MITDYTTVQRQQYILHIKLAFLEQVNSNSNNTATEVNTVIVDNGVSHTSVSCARTDVLTGCF